MRPIKLLALLALLALPLVVTSSASALDIDVDKQPPPGEVGTPYEFEFEGEEGCVPYTFKHLAGTLPPGLRITPEGELEGTPTEAGTFYFWVELTDNGGPSNPFCLEAGTPSQGDFTMIVRPDLAVTTTSLPIAVPGQPYSTQLTFSNPEVGWPVVWDITAGSLPNGLTLSPSGLISGTPTGADRKTFTVRAREPFRRSGEKELTLTVAAALQAASSFRTGEVGVAYAAKVSASGGLPPYRYALASGTLPAGLALDEKTGAVTGTPEEAGVVAATFTVTDSGGQRANVPVSFRIAEALTITTSRFPFTRVGTGFQARLRASGGLAPRKWRISAGKLPRGIRLDGATGVLSGTARKAGTYRFTVEAADRLGATSSKQLTLRVLDRRPDS